MDSDQQSGSSTLAAQHKSSAGDMTLFKRSVIWGVAIIVALLWLLVAIPGELELAQFRKQSEGIPDGWVLERQHRVDSTSFGGVIIHSTHMLVLGDAEEQDRIEKRLRAHLLPGAVLICSPTYSAPIRSERFAQPPPHDIRHYYIYRLRMIEWYDYGQWLTT